jgi:preprotein translocase subunit SecD
MGQRYNTYLAVIIVILAAVIWIDLPSNPGIHIGNFNMDLATKLGLDLRGGLSALLEVDLPVDTVVTAQQMEDAKTILESRSNALGVSETSFQVTGGRRIIAEFPGLTNTADVIKTLKTTGQLAFVPMGQAPLKEGDKIKVDYTTAGTAVENLPTPTATTVVTPEITPTPGGPTLTPTAVPTEAALPVYPALLTGADLSSVEVGQNLGQYYIAFTLKDSGAKVFADYTSKHVGDYLAIALDNTLISVPVVNSAITEGKGQIEGNFSRDSANNLAVQLRSGSLPVPLKVVESRAVGATLGQDSIKASFQAGIIGLVMVILFMIVSYRLPGLLASIALIVYAATAFAIFKLIGVTLTLPGIAGFVLSIGVAVDANILIFERLKEELRAGRGLRQAIDVAWTRAWTSIRDSNITTLITCFVLFVFGSFYGASIVKGFAVTLSIGVVVSLVTAVFVTRTFLHIVLDNLKFAEHPMWFRA